VHFDPRHALPLVGRQCGGLVGFDDDGTETLSFRHVMCLFVVSATALIGGACASAGLDL